MQQSINTTWPVVLSVAGFDPSGGAGIVADLKTFAAHNCYGVAALTALTVQNSQGVASAHPVDPLVLRESILSLLSDGRVRAVKIGMLSNQANAEVVCEILESNPDLPAVLDPVVRSSSDFSLLDAAGFEFVRRQLLSRVAVVTPNMAEAAALAEMPVNDLEGMKAAARKLVELGARAVVVTGGHLDKPIDVFFDGTTMEAFDSDRVKPDNTHGTGCTFSSAVAANLALGRRLRDAVVLAKAYVVEAIRQAFPVGPGRIPLNHLYRMAQPARIFDHSPVGRTPGLNRNRSDYFRDSPYSIWPQSKPKILSPMPALRRNRKRCPGISIHIAEQRFFPGKPGMLAQVFCCLEAEAASVPRRRGEGHAFRHRRIRNFVLNGAGRSRTAAATGESPRGESSTCPHKVRSSATSFFSYVS